jgi:aminomethyltransferase
MTDSPRVYHLALRDLHAAAGARFEVRDGWSMPVDYGDWRAEHAAIREGAAMADRSQRSRFMLSGTDALDVLQVVFAGHLHDLEEGRAMRTVALDEAGNIRDLALIARTGGIAYLVSGEPGQRFETLARLNRAVRDGFDVRIDDRTESTCLLGLAGPAAQAKATEHLSEGLPARLQTLHCVTFEFHGFRALAIRTSDLGEDGFEFMLAPAVAQHIIETLQAAGVPLVGSMAQETARVEACVPAFAPDLDPGLSPAEADLDVLLGIEGGREGRMLAALVLEGEGVPGVGARVENALGAVGEVRSCVRSPSLDATIALAVLDQGDAVPGAALMVGGQRANVARKPLYRRRTAT